MPEYPADLPLANKLQLDLLERIAVAVERIANAAEITASPVPTEVESTVAPGTTSPTVQTSHKKHGRGGSNA